MKNYLLKAHLRPKICGGRFWLITCNDSNESILDQLWRFIKDKHFLAVHFKYCDKELIKSFEFQEGTSKEVGSVGNIPSIEDQVTKFIVESDICLGILPKKGNASIRSMLKVYKLEDYYDRHLNGTNHLESNLELQKVLKCHGAHLQGINTIGYLSRMELYVSEKRWRESTFRQKSALTALIDLLEEQISTVLLNWNQMRSHIYKEFTLNEHLNVHTSSMFKDRENIMHIRLTDVNINQAIQMK